MHHFLRVVGVVAIVCTLSASPGRADTASDVAEAMRRVILANQLLMNGKGSEALELLTPALDLPGYALLPGPIRLLARSSIAWAHVMERRPVEAYAVLFAIAVDPSIAVDEWYWAQRVNYGVDAGLHYEATSDAIYLLETYPGFIDTVDPWLIPRAFSSASENLQGTRIFADFLDAMAAADYVPPDYIGNDLFDCERMKQRASVGDTEQALAIRSGIANPNCIASLYYDKRFDGLTGGQTPFDAESLLARRLTEAREIVLQRPHELLAQQVLIDRLLEAGRFEEALAEINEAEQRADDNDYSDVTQQLEWVFTAKATALTRLGRYDEAIDAQYEAVEAATRSNDPISQWLNLAVLLVLLEQPAAALDIVDSVAAVPRSGYGDGVEAMIRVCAAAQLGDRPAVDDALTHLRAQPATTFALLQSALLCADRPQQLVAVIRGGLSGSKRGKVLEALQTYGKAEQYPPFAQELIRRMQGVLALPEVVALLAGYGRATNWSFFGAASL